eukprot:TRINITY_DN12679_c0_g1_i2.p1 TRINITY_DN12679_c0_g1~~TRINITY_DN12679_c0_g1_i2.p1  ORF type:complete len:389 (+),score=154.58 TRINITY_DN12679_c0_g1_i2:39-1205(+)
MASQKGKKVGYVAKLEKALAAKGADLAKVLQPFKEMISREHQKEVMKHPELLRAWVARMDEELENQDLGALYHLMHTCSCQVFRSFEEEPEAVRESGLVELVVKCIKKLTTTGLEQPDVLATILDVAEVINDDSQLRSELFLNCVNDLIYIGTHIEHAAGNRRIALLMIKAAMQGSEAHRAALDVESLAKHLSETDDFTCQSYIVATLVKLLTKEKKKSEVTPILVKCWGEKWVKRLKAMFHKSLACSDEFVLEFNNGHENPQVVTLKCNEWQLEDTRFTQETDPLLCHCSPSAISFNIPVPDGEGEAETVDTVDIPIVSINKLHKNKGEVTIEIKPAKLPQQLQPFSKKSVFCFKIKAKADDAYEWCQVAGKRTQELRKVLFLCIVG